VSSALPAPQSVLYELVSHQSRARRSTARRRATLIAGVTILAVVIVACLAAPLITGSDPNAIDVLAPLQPPLTPGHPLGTDQYGRDILARILYGGRIDLLIAFGATSVTLVVGSLIGLLSGYVGGWIDSVIMRIVDLVFAFPFVVLIIAIVAMLGPSIFNMVLAIWFTSWITYTRIVRTHTLTAKRQEYTLAAKALGYRSSRVVLRHILPNVLSYVVVFAMVDAVANIGLTASLGFLGLGAKPPSPEWGAMIADGRAYILTSWWLPTMPGLAIVTVGVGFSLVGDGLADILRAGD
jgi:peptide/nickel transport system permease protein